MSAFPPPPSPAPDAPRVARLDPVTEAVRAALALADRAREADGVAPF
ncbi:mycothiol synthase, partial [Clavibacter nebraskensis]